MRSLAISFAAAAALTATPAAAEIYACTGEKGPARAIEVEVQGNRLAMLEGSKVRVLCGPGGSDCPRMIDGGYTYIGDDGMILFDPGPVKLSIKPWDGPAAEYRCGPADAAVRARFAKG